MYSMIYGQCVSVKFNWVNCPLSPRLVPRPKGQRNETEIPAHRSPKKGDNWVNVPVVQYTLRLFNLAGFLHCNWCTSSNFPAFRQFWSLGFLWSSLRHFWSVFLFDFLKWNLTLCQICWIPDLQLLKLVCFMVANTWEENMQILDFESTYQNAKNEKFEVKNLTSLLYVCKGLHRIYIWKRNSYSSWYLNFVRFHE